MGDKGLAIDVFCGLGGWTEGLLSAGYRVVGFDNHRHEYALPEESPEATGHKHTKPVEKRGWTQGCAISLGMEGADQKPLTRIARYPAQLILQDALTIHGSQLKDAAVIVASPPCQNYSYLAMPWSRSTDPENSKAAKALRKKWETEGPDNRLFDACFRIHREAIEANTIPCPGCGSKAAAATFRDGHTVCFQCGGPGMKSRYIPLIVENVRGAVPWVGKRDMPLEEWNRLTQSEKIERGRPQAVFGSFYLFGDVAQIGNRVIAGRDLADIRAGRGRFGMGVAPESTAVKVPTLDDGRRTDVGKGARFTSRDCGVERNSPEIPDSSAKSAKSNGGWFNDYKQDGEGCVGISRTGSKSNARKAASALIAKIPAALSRYIAEQHLPAELSKTARTG